MKIIIDKKYDGCDLQFWSVTTPNNDTYPSKDWKKAKLDCCIDLKYTKSVTSKSRGTTKVYCKIPNTKSACVKVAKAMTSKGFETDVRCGWGFALTQFAISK